MPVTVKRLSDHATKTFAVDDHTRVRDLKKLIHEQFPPKTAHGCRLLSPHGKVMKAVHRLKHYKLGPHAEITMDDSKDWQSSSSASDSDRD